MRTSEERKEAVRLLTENKKVAPETSFFGDDNHRKIDVMVETIENDYDEDDVDDNFGHDEDDLSAAQDAINYLSGDTEIEELLFDPR
jgi:hypothetical protein